MSSESRTLSWNGCHVCHSFAYYEVEKVKGGVEGAAWRRCDFCGTLYQSEVSSQREYRYGHTLEERVDSKDFQRTARVIGGILGDLRGLNVLDLGCGVGWLGTLLTSQSGAVVTCLELPQNSLTHLKSKVAQIVNVNVEKVGIPEQLWRQFDVVINWEILEHVYSPDFNWFTLMSRLLKPKGRLLARYCDEATIRATGKGLSAGEWRYPTSKGLLGEMTQLFDTLSTTDRYILAESNYR